MAKLFVVSQNHLDSVNVTASDFINSRLSPSSTVNYSIESGSEFKSLGQKGKGFSVTTQGLLRTTYNFTYPDLSIADVTTLRSLNQDTGNGRDLLVFNDPSDNYIFDYGADGVRQYGILRKVGFNTFRPFKVYQAGKHRAFYPIYFFDAASEVKVNGAISGSWALNRNSGTIYSINGTDLSGQPFETDLYYKLVRAKAPMEIEHKAASGILTDLSGYSNVDTAIACEQTFAVTVQLEDVYLTEKLNDVVVKPDIAADDLTLLDLTKYQNELKVSDKFNKVIKQLGSNTFSSKLLNDTPQPVKEITIPSRQLGIKELNYWKTVYLATSGGSFFLNN